MKKLYALFLCIGVLVEANSQTLYSSTLENGFRFNPGLGLGNTPKIVFDDINILSDVIADADSIGFTKIKVGIRQVAGAPAVTVNVYLTGQDPASFGLDSLPAIPPTLIGTFNLPANATASGRTQIVAIGDSVNVFKALARDTGNLTTGFQTCYLGVSFSNANGANGWRFTDDGANFDIAWEYNADSTEPRSAFSFGGTPSATFYAQAFGRPVYSALAFDVRTVAVNVPENITCFSGPQTITVDVQNIGLNPVAAGAAAVTLKVGGANTYSRTIANAGAIAPNGTATITFSDVDLSLPGVSLDTAFVSYGADLRNSNDTALSGTLTAETINNFPITDDIEGTTLTIMPFVATIAGDQLWTIHFADTAYTNPDMVDSLHPNSGQSFMYFDSYVGPNSVGVESRLFSNCVALGNPPNGGSCNSSLSFFMSHDTTFLTPNFDDSLYVSVSTDQGNSWTRIAGFRRLNEEYGVPGWGQEIVDLTPYNGSTIQVAFEGVSQWGSIIGVDDIQIFSDCVVPVTLGSFTVSKQNKANRLNWTTSLETNSLKFVIEQSRNGRQFVSLGEVAAAGNSNTERSYSFTHNLPLSGYNYYRIKMVDRDNKVKYSEVRNVKNLGLNEIMVTPNPVANTMKVSISTESADVATIVISDMSGKTVYTKNYNVTAGENDIPVNTASLTAGSYIVKVQLNGDVQVNKFIKL